MEVEVEKLERAKENTSTKLMQTEKDLQLALKAEQQAHEEDNERMTKERVNFFDYGKQNVQQNAFHLRDKFYKLTCMCYVIFRQNSTCLHPSCEIKMKVPETIHNLDVSIHC